MARADVPSVDETYELLSHREGRLVLQYFDQHDNPVKLENIALMVARWETPNGETPSEEKIEHVSQKLHDEYLPWFAELGLATYDSNGQMVRYDATVISTAIENAEATLAFVWS